MPIAQSALRTPLSLTRLLRIALLLAALLPCFATAQDITPTAPPPPVEEPGAIVKKTAMNETGAELGAAIDDLADTLARHGAPWANRKVRLGINWLKLLTSVAFLLMLAIGSPILRIWIARGLRPKEGDKGPNAFQVFLDAIRPPLYLIIWACGVYWALTPLYPHFVDAAGKNPIRTAASIATDVLALLALAWFLVRLIRLVARRLRLWAAESHSVSAEIIGALALKCLRLILPIVALLIVMPMLNLPVVHAELLNRLASLGLIAGVAWIVIQAIDAFETIIYSRYQMDVADNLQARRVYTQVNLLKKVVVSLVVIITVASMLMVFDSVRQYGGSLLASAGIAGVILGIAAQRSLSGIFASFQIAIAQPIRIEDVVVVEGEFGKIEEISLSYVTVRIWDDRRLILPISYFIEKPFQNWTRSSAQILGSVFLYVDHTAPLPALREELARIAEASPHWDRRFTGLQVTDMKPDHMELRILATATSASVAWDLRCEIREKMIAWLVAHHPESLACIRYQPTFDQERTRSAPMSPVPGISTNPQNSQD